MFVTVRAGIRLVLFFILSLTTVVLVGAGNLLLRTFSRGWAVSWKNCIIGLWARLMCTILNIDIQLEGNPPEPPFFLVSNHLSYIDVIPLWLLTKGTFIAKSEVSTWPFFGWATRILGVIFIDRNMRRDVQRVNKLIASSISDRQGVMIFPEGTSTNGTDVKVFHSSLLQYPAEEYMPVSYVTLSYRSGNAERPASQHICWWDDMPFFGHFWELLKLSGFEVSVIFGEKPVRERDRKRLADRLRERIKKDFVPVATEADRPKQPELS